MQNERVLWVVRLWSQVEVNANSVERVQECECSPRYLIKALKLIVFDNRPRARARGAGRDRATSRVAFSRG